MWHEWTGKQPKAQEPSVHSVASTTIYILLCVCSGLVFLLIRSDGPDRPKTQGPAMKSGHCPCTSEIPCNPLQVQANLPLDLQYHIWFLIQYSLMNQTPGLKCDGRWAPVCVNEAIQALCFFYSFWPIIFLGAGSVDVDLSPLETTWPGLTQQTWIGWSSIGRE